MIETRPMTAAERAARIEAPVPSRHSPPSTVDSMAAHMIDIWSAGGESCSDHELKLRGFTDSDLLHHGVEANRIATARSGGGSC